MSPRAKFALGLGSVAVVAGGAAWALSTLASKAKEPPGPVKLGALLCPAERGKIPAESATLHRGDFIVVQLRSDDGKFSEPTWATVLDANAEQVAAVLTGEQVDEGVKAIATAKHGFRLGHRLVVPRDCIWEIFRPSENLGQILCGPEITELAAFAKEDFAPIRGGLTLDRGDGAKVIVADKASYGNTWWEPLWTRIATISPTGQVLTGIVTDEPELGERHGLVRGSVLRFNRDCVIGVS